MARRTLNLGILAHVDAGKTTLTERLLYSAGAIAELGSVDDGTTQTDYLTLERQRGITIRSAVASFEIGDVTVNLIDTPGHPDFIAEVERVLSVLDGAVLVVSAVEGVQPQTRILMRALRRLRVPTIVFVNKIDRAGADERAVLAAIAARLTPDVVALGTVRDPGTRSAGFTLWATDDPELESALAAVLAEHDDELLAALVDDARSVSPAELHAELRAQTARALVHPVLFGSALTGAGVLSLMAGIAELLPAQARDADGPVSAAVFKIERSASGEKIAYVRVFSGTIRARDRLELGPDVEEKVTAVGVFAHGSEERRPALSAGEIGKLWGLRSIQVGDRIGETGTAAARHRFAPPTLESTVVPRDPGAKRALHVALAQLAEQDPLIDVRQDSRNELCVSLYGEVQKEVIQATLANDFGLEVEFRETSTICVERPVGSGEALELLHAASNPFLATIGIRVDPAPIDSGIAFGLEIDARSAPLYAYKTLESFAAHMDRYVRDTLREGRFGWAVTDCAVTMTECVYSVPDGPPSRRGPLSTPADFRKLTPMVVMQALEQARTVVCEPVLRVRLEVPSESLGAAHAVLSRLGAVPHAPSLRGDLATLETLLPAARAHEAQRQLPAATAGEGALESEFAGYEPVTAEPPPARPRTSPNPLNRQEYLLHLARRMG